MGSAQEGYRRRSAHRRKSVHHPIAARIARGARGGDSSGVDRGAGGGTHRSLRAIALASREVVATARKFVKYTTCSALVLRVVVVCVCSVCVVVVWWLWHVHSVCVWTRVCSCTCGEHLANAWWCVFVCVCVRAHEVKYRSGMYTARKR